MDREQEEMQFLGLWGIYRESYQIIISYRKLFSQITLALILPLSFLLLAHIEVSNLLFSKIVNNSIQLDHTPKGDTKRQDRLSDLVSSEWLTLFLFKLVYLILFLVFSLLSTSAVVFTIASVYTARHVSFRKVMSVVPKVWKRLMVTFLCAFLVFFAYNVVFSLCSFLVFFTLGLALGLRLDSKAFWAIVIVLVVIYVAGFVYLTILWQMASVVSVLEDFKGFRAMGRSKDLIQGKMWVAAFIFFKLNSSAFAIKWLFGSLVVHGGDSTGPLIRVLVGLLCFLLLIQLFLFGLVVQTVFYFVCKSYHHENIDKSTLSDHLEVYLGEYVPLKTKDVQLEQFDF